MGINEYCKQKSVDFGNWNIILHVYIKKMKKERMGKGTILCTESTKHKLLLKNQNYYITKIIVKKLL